MGELPVAGRPPTGLGRADGFDRRDAQRAWARSGGMALTGWPDPSPPLAPAAPVASLLEHAGRLVGAPDAAALVGERGGARAGAVSCGGATRLLPAADGWVAVALARPVDVDAVPAWLDVPPTWDGVAAAIQTAPATEVVERARLLEIPASILGERRASAPWQATALGAATPLDHPPFVVDLSTLWAGPLCADLLERRGATVVKVEDPRRPDGGRGQPLFELLNAGKRPEAIGVDSPALVDLLRQADVVVTSARPRVFEQLDLQPARFLGESPTVWVGVTAHGWDGPGRNRVGFGDDAAVAGGLVAWTDHGPAFVADAVADPLCGTLAAAAAVECLAAGGSWFVDVSLAGVAAYAVSLAEAGPAASAVRTDAGWALADGTPVLPPRARSIRR